MQNRPKGWLTFKEFEAVLWTLGQLEDYPEGVSSDPDDPLMVLVNEGYSHTDVAKVCREMQETDDKHWISSELTPLKKAILRVSVENSTWVRAYVVNGPVGSSTSEDCKATLRGLAKKLEDIGIGVNYIPND